MIRLPRAVGEVAAIAALAAAVGCSEDDPVGPDPSASGIELETQRFSTLRQSEGHFELWISFAQVRAPGGTGPARGPQPRHANAVSAGKFKVDDGQRLVGLDFQPTGFAIDPADSNADVDRDGRIDWQLAVDAFITLEPEGDADGQPSASAMVGGLFQSGTAFLAVDYVDAFNQDFTGAGGSFVMLTPTTTAETDSADSPAAPDWDLAGGVWFSNAAGDSGTLELPALPPSGGWDYAGWISLGTAGSSALGRFTNPGAPDSDGPGPLGPIDGPGFPFPGSDFPTGSRPQNLAQSVVFVTLEPALNQDGPGPFFPMTVLTADELPAALTPGQSFPLASAAGSLPAATVRIPGNASR